MVKNQGFVPHFYVNFGMITLITLITITICVVIGFYAIILLQQLRKKYNHEYLNSLFYFQVLTYLFGLYGILGNLLMREILPKFDVSKTAIDTIFLFLPVLGIPFLIAGWYLLIKTAADLCLKKTKQSVAIVYFLLTTLSVLFYGYYVLKFDNINHQLLIIVRQNIYLGFGLIELLIIGYVVTFLFIQAIVQKSKTVRIFLSQFALILAVVTILKAVALYLSEVHFSIGLYFLVLYFAGTLPLVFLTKKYIQNTKGSEVSKELSAEDLFEEYHITPREKEIILEICHGKSNKEISESLFITLQTVKDHCSNIYRKTGVRNRVQLSQLFKC